VVRCIQSAAAKVRRVCVGELHLVTSKGLKYVIPLFFIYALSLPDQPRRMIYYRPGPIHSPYP
jgi:hypothetical protein